MPTNPLWIEHTEKAAWDTVQTLRSELERERKHVERLTRLRPAWEKLLALLDEAKRDFALDAEDPTALVAELGERARGLERERDALKADLDRRTREQTFVPPASAPIAFAATGPVRKSSAMRWFARLIEERRALRSSEKKSDPARLVRALEVKVDDLAQARSNELLDLAVDIGVLALELARAARRSLRARH
jgi:hypothetical protein